MRHVVVTTRLLRQSRTARQPRTGPQPPDPATTRRVVGTREDEPPSGHPEAGGTGRRP
jgi:hypothetical protein